MKQIAYSIVIIVLFIGCEAFENTATIGVPISYESTFSVVANTDNGYTFTDSTTLDIQDNPEVVLNSGKIKGFEVKKIECLISKVVSEAEQPTLLISDITFADINNPTQEVSTTIDNIDLKKASTNKTVFPFIVDDKSDLEALLSSVNALKMSYKAQLDTATTYTVNITVDISVKVGI